MFNQDEINRILFVYKKAENDRKRKTAVISLAIEFDVQPKFIRLAIIRNS